MINPTTITNYNRTEAELEEFLMFAILVAGKNSQQQAVKLDKFLSTAKEFGLPSTTTPFEYLEYLSRGKFLSSVMVNCKLGQYNRLEVAFEGILKFKNNLKNVTIEQLEGIKGIGSKTARFFVLHSRTNVECAVLDTHILKWLAKATGIGMPKQTPSKKKYGTIEQLFLTEARIRGISPADLDLQIWTSLSQKTLAS